MKTYYVHHVSGRLRVRVAAAKRNEERASAVKALLQSTDGVRSVTVNPLTGSVTVYYDEQTTGHLALLDLLNERGFLAGQPERVYLGGQPSLATVIESSPSASSGSQVSTVLTATVATFLVEKAIEYSIRALVASLF